MPSKNGTPAGQKDVKLRRTLKTMEQEITAATRKLNELQTLYKNLPAQISQLQTQQLSKIGYAQAIREHLEIEPPTDPALPTFREQVEEKEHVKADASEG